MAQYAKVLADYMLNHLSPIPSTRGKARLGSASLLISAPAGGRMLARQFSQISELQAQCKTKSK